MKKITPQSTHTGRVKTYLGSKELKLTKRGREYLYNHNHEVLAAKRCMICNDLITIVSSGRSKQGNILCHKGCRNRKEERIVAVTCIDCSSIILATKTNQFKRCEICHRLNLNKTHKERARKKSKLKPVKIRTCVDCGKKIQFEGNKRSYSLIKRCKKCCEKHIHYITCRKNSEVIVLTKCIDCGLLMVKNQDIGRTRYYCDECAYEHSRHWKDRGVLPSWKISKCLYCGEYITKHYRRQRFCKKCSKTYWKFYHREYSKAFRGDIKRASLDRYYTKIRPNLPPKVCKDCGRGITLTGRRIRCKECQDEHLKKVAKENSKIRYKRLKWYLNSQNGNTIGTLSTKKDCGIKRKKDGTPDWEAEAKEVKKLKEKVFRKRRMHRILKGDIERISNRERDRLDSEQMNK